MRTRIRGAAAVTAALLAVPLVLTACSGGASPAPGESSPSSPSTTTGGAPVAGGTLTIAASNDNNSFDRADLAIGNQTQYWMPVYDTLLVLDAHATLQPNLATAWSYNADATVLTLTLRTGVTFSDGTPFDASAVKANLEYLAAGTGQNAYMAKSVSQFDVVSPTEIKLHLSAPDPGLLGYLAVVGGAMASPPTLGTDGSKTMPIGSGPYRLDPDATTPGSQYTYRKDTGYWNSSAFPYDTIVIKPMQDNTARLNALKTGQVDVGNIEPQAIAEAEASGLEITRNLLDWRGLFIADRAGTMVPALADVRVRQAINYAFDKEAILKNLQLSEGEVTSQPFNRLSEAYVADLDGYYSYDIDKARSLMSEAGYPDGFEVTMPDLAAFPQVTPIIEQQLAQIGIRVKWVKVGADAAIPALLSGKYPMFWFSLGSQSAWQDMRKFAFTESPWNSAHVADPKLADLLAQVQATQGAEQKAAFQAVNRYLVENAFFAPWYRVALLQAHSPKVSVTVQPWNAVPWISGFQPTP